MKTTMPGRFCEPLVVPQSTVYLLDERRKKFIYPRLVSRTIYRKGKRCGFLGEKGHQGSQRVLQLRKLLKESMEMASLLLLQVFFPSVLSFVFFLPPSVFRLGWLLRKLIEKKSYLESLDYNQTLLFNL